MKHAEILHAHQLAAQCRLALAQIYSGGGAVEGAALFPLLNEAAALETRIKYLADAVAADDKAPK